MKSMKELEILLCDELDKIASEGELTAGSLDTIDKLTHSIKSLLTIMAMKGESYDYYGRSYARMSRRGYSRDADVREQIMDIMDDVHSPKVRQMLHKALEKMEE